MARRRSFSVTIREIKIAGEEVRFEFHPDENDFRASFMGETYSDSNFNALVNTVRKKGKEWKPTVAIQVTKIEHGNGAKGNEYTDLTVTGVHSGNRNVMAREDANGEVHQLSWFQFGDRDPDRRDGYQSWRDRDEGTPNIVRRLTREERQELDELTRFANQAEKRRDDTQRTYRIKISAEIKRQQARTKEQSEQAVENDALEGDPRVNASDSRSRKRR